ncbi:hypothetical protein PL11_000095 [Lentilactobacillus curieae]|uniref:DUF3862 domain-containing protein n=1 Tax=Lentilactobacillus curieae TaxID=1138822 RepID=A0A1S6QFT0_9LACO|nr:DUF3862 domain-containing protein [Lentilactobacillus curieae]AQW20461.1 hypothetical protein PL11_000095 [Lentilactobacillus curieae]
MHKLFSLFLTVTMGIVLAACGANNATPSKNDKPAVNQTTGVDSSDYVTLKNYQNIKVGAYQTGNGGSTATQVTNWMGNPASKSKVTVPGTKKTAIRYTWGNTAVSFNAASVSVQFLNGKVIGKGYAAQKDNAKLVNSARLNSIQNGTNYHQVVSRLGTPNAESLIGTGKVSAKQLTYVINKDGGAVNLTFNGDKLKSKTNTTIN